MHGFRNFLVKCFNVVYPYKIYGKENIPEGGAILVCNHFSAIDCAFLVNVYSKDNFFMCKKEIFDSKFLAFFVKRFGGIPIDRGGTDLKSFFATVKILKGDHKLTIFAEGTRNKTGTDELQELKSGPTVLSVKTKKPIVPIMILKKPKIFRRTKLLVGKPIDFSEYYDKKFDQDAIDKMNLILRESMLEVQRELKEKVYSKKRKTKSR